MVLELTIRLIYLRAMAKMSRAVSWAGGSLNANDPAVEARPRPAEGRDSSLGQVPLEPSPIPLSPIVVHVWKQTDFH